MIPPLEPLLPGNDSPGVHLAHWFLVAHCSREESHRLLDQFLLIAVLQETGGNISRAATRLQLHRNTFSRALQKLEMRSKPSEIAKLSRIQPSLPFPKKPATRVELSVNRKLAS